MNPLLFPVELPFRLASRVVDDARTVARRFDARLDMIQQQAGVALEIFADLRRLATDGVRMIGALDEQMQSVAANMQSVNETLISIDAQTQKLNASLPAVQRGFELLEPLEGTVERVGRVVDRLPRWISGEPKSGAARPAADLATHPAATAGSAPRPAPGRPVTAPGVVSRRSRPAR